MKEKIILGIDPGSCVLGYGIICINKNQLKALGWGSLELKKYKDHFLKMEQIFHSILKIIDKHLPDEAAFEAPFYGKNIQSMLKLGRAQGIAIAACLSRQIPILEYAPKKVKLAVTGHGNADKSKVAEMIKSILNINCEFKNYDASDALAIAICHAFQPINNNIKSFSKASWSQFLKDNPKRILK